MDLEKMIESETPDSLKIAELIEERSQINDYKNELEICFRYLKYI